MIPAHVQSAGDRYLALADRLLPGRVVAFYLVGSIALGAYRQGRSDIDFVAVTDDDLDTPELRRVRALQMASGIRSAIRAARRRHSPLTGTWNGVFICQRDLARPVSDITPIVAHVGHTFTIGHAGSDVSPVAWKILARHGIPLRGPAPESLGLDPQPALLRAWNLENLDTYWASWARSVQRSPRRRFGLRPRWSSAWGVLGATRLHHTIATGDVISKEDAGEYALDTFPQRWHLLIRDALAYWHRQPDRMHVSAEIRGRLTAEYVLEVADSAHQLPSSPAG